MEKIGLGIITYNAPEKLMQSAFSVPDFIDNFVIVNDGNPYTEDCYPAKAHIIQHTQNLKVAHSKNDALKYLMEKGCEHIFLMEDDVIIHNPEVFQAYINVSQKTGILHLNFALQGPHNFKVQLNKKTSAGDLSDRVFNENEAEPNPLITLQYNNGASISLYKACVGAFSYFRRSVIEKSGYFDINFKNSWEHVEHTYRIIKDGSHPPFGWFADISNSDKYLRNIPNCMENSTIAKDPQWKINSEIGENYFKSIHGYIPGRIPKSSKRQTKSSLIQIYNNTFTKSDSPSFGQVSPIKKILSFFIKPTNSLFTEIPNGVKVSK